MNTVAIVGVGLIGGSFARALQQTGYTGRILGVSSERTTREALALGVIHEAVSLDEAAARADLLFLAQPILHLINDLAKLQGKLKPGALVTDGGSTKARICEAGRVLGAQFIGGHPMAGKEARGVQYATGDLFRGCNWVLTPNDREHLSQPGAVWLKDRIAAFGAKLVVLSPDVHDRVVASTSHLVQLLSTSLAVTLADVAEAPSVVGPAAIEMTRVAMSDFGMWADIFATNPHAIDAALGNFIDNLTQIRSLLADPALREKFEQAAASAKRLRAPNVKDLS